MRQIAADNPHTLSVLVRVTPGLRDGLDAWLGEINAHVVGPRWSRTDLLREALAYVARTRPQITAPPLDIQKEPARVPAVTPVAPPVDIPKPRAAKTVAPKAKAQPMGAGHTPAVANRASPDPDALRQRCKAYCAEHPDAKPALAKAMGYQSVAALGNWLRGSKTASETKLEKAERWLAKH